MFSIGSTVVFEREKYRIVRLYPKAGRAELKNEMTGKTVYLKPFFMQYA